MKKQILCLLFVSFITVPLWGQEPILNIIETKLKSYNSILPYEKVYVQCDRPFYKPGDDIWMAAWITDGITNKVSDVSQILTIELINSKGTVEKTRRILASSGRATYDFALDSAAFGGIYKIKAYTNWMQNFGSENLFVKEIQVQNVLLPRLRMKLDMERKAYGAGDTVRGKLLLQTLENNPLSNSSFTYTVNLNGEEFLHSNAETNQTGNAVISFVLPSTLQSNDGLLNVSIIYKGNTESVARSIPIILNQIDLQFFPEGGDLLTGTTNNCAFKALNEYGKPADIEGAVFNSKHQLVTKFKSYHNGMGAFHFAPQPNERYYALIDRPDGILQLYPLPQPVNYGYLMEIPEPMEFIQPDAQMLARVRIVAPETTKVSLIAQVQGRIIFSSTYAVKKGENIFSIPLSKFPCGVAQLTLFTQNNMEVCERLVFVKKSQQLKLQVTSDKTSYRPREKVKLNIQACDTKGKPVATQLALSVVDDKLLSMADDKSDNILSYLLLSSEVKGKIEEPNFYFNPQETKADTAIDYLLLTQGWRRFTWEEVVETSSHDLAEKVTYHPEKRILCGTIKGKNSRDVQKTKLYIKETGQTAKPEANGYYEFKELDLTTPLTLIAITNQNDTIKTVIRDYTSVKTINNYYYDNWDGKGVYGIVKDKNTSEPIPGVSIVVKGTTNGTCTDIDGRFYLKAEDKDILVFSFIGYKSIELMANFKMYNTIELEEESINLEEIVVASFGIQRTRRMLSYSVQQVQPKSAIKIATEQDNARHQVEKKTLKPVVDKKDLTKSIKNEGTTIRIPSRNEEEEIVEEEDIFFVVEEMPSFPGNSNEGVIRWLRKNMRYPEKAQEECIQGRVFVRFTISKNGDVVDPVIIRGIDPACDEEVLRVVRTMPKWRPGKQRGKPVDVQFTLPVTFTLVDGCTSYSSYEVEEQNRRQFQQYYRARQFYAPIYSEKEEVEKRRDFRKTIYWNPTLATDSTGKGYAEFYASDELTTFRSTVEGINNNGEIGRNEYTFYTKKPISVDAIIPEYVNYEDTISIPVTFKNTTSRVITGKFQVEFPSLLNPISPIPQDVAIPANDAFLVYLDFAVPCKRENGFLKLIFEADSLRDVIASPIAALPYGFPHKITLSGKKLSNRFEVSIPPIISNSLQSELVVYPSLQSSLTSTIQALLKEPYGCFEQASATTYPNVLALQYLKETKQTNKQLEENAIRYITNGYKLLTKYETSTQGFEWFGKTPAHEGLTAFGLMEFYDMKAVCPIVEENMFNRTLAWLLSRKDNKGGFLIGPGKYGFSNNAYLLNNAYLIYALSEIENKNIQREFDCAYRDNHNRNDAYCLALLANSALNLKDTVKANILIDKIKKQIAEHDLSNIKSETSITGSGGKSLKVETIALFSLALLKYPTVDEPLLQSCIRYIVDSRSFGSFGSTQANVLALKALTKYCRNHDDLLKPGNVVVNINGKAYGQTQYNSQQSTPLVIGNLADNLIVGENVLNVDFNETLFPADFNINIEYYSRVPLKGMYSPVRIETNYKQKSVRRGETVRLTVTVKNIENSNYAMTVAIVSVPTGFSFQSWQLKEMQEKNIFDYYEIRNNELYIYYKTLEPNALHTINFDLKANIPGIYHSAVSNCYLYYTPEYKSYSNSEAIEIRK